MRLLWLTSLLGFLSMDLLAQDSIRYTSAVEKNNIENFIKTRSLDSFELFYCIDNGNVEDLQAAKIRCSNWIENKKKENIDFTKEKNIKKVLEDIHVSFLNKYVLNTQFSSIFSTGEFNCVTSSALYKMLLSGLGIEAEIKELSTHVYLTVKLGPKYLDVETTIPTDLVRISKKTKEEYVDQLLKDKQVTQEEIDVKGVIKIFDEIYYQNKTISLTQLGGLAYSNYALKYLDSNDYFEALSVFRISRNLYPRVQVNSFCGQILDQIGKEISRFSFYSLIREQLLFSDLYDPINMAEALRFFAANEVLKKSNVNQLLMLDSFIRPEIIKDPDILFETRQMYLMALAEYYMKTDNFLLASKNYAEVYKLNPLNLDVDFNLRNCVDKVATHMIDSFEKVTSGDLKWLCGLDMYKFKKEYQALIYYVMTTVVTNNKIAKVWEDEQLDSIADFVLEKLDKAPMHQVQEEMIAEAYLQLAYTYFNKGDAKKTSMIVSRAKRKFPDNDKIETATYYYVK